jgi:GNAT superfamily N-acetyltransferase
VVGARTGCPGVSERIEAVGEPLDGLSVGPEPFDSEGPLWVVAQAEAELIARYGSLGDGELGLNGEMFGLPSGSFLVARDGAVRSGASGPPVGGVGLRRVDEGVGEVRRLWVDPSWRGRGVGRSLMARLEGAAFELGLENLVLATGDRQPEAVQLYGATGWTRLYVDREGKPLAPGWIRFAKALG